MSTRDLSIDYLRFLGLSLIILAHASVPFTLAQIRCFDVPLMIFISGLTAARKSFPTYGKYLVGRTKRLLVPVYIFLSVYLLVLILAQTLEVIPKYVDVKMILDSYLLLGGVGYVWIIRVFLLMMLVTPLLVGFEKYCKSDFLYGIVCLFLLVLNDVILHFASFTPERKYVSLILTEYVMYLVGYAPLFMLGLRLRYAGRNVLSYYVLWTILVLLIGLYVYKLFHGFPIELSQHYKYPPQSYYLIYGAAVSVILWFCKNLINKIILACKLSSLALFVGQNTIWIYLWHMPFVLF